MQIEAKLDLHGLRQAEAHRRLRSFLLSAHARGVRMVLVITGKGSGTVDPAGLGTEGVGRGIIRRNVPLWLGEPDLRAIVIGTAPAHARHGGDGALYVHLRKPRGP
jgi:DNA-nicking Smr family endonuclease